MLTTLTNVRKRGGNTGPVTRAPAASDGGAAGENSLIKKFLCTGGPADLEALATQGGKSKISMEDRKNIERQAKL